MLSPAEALERLRSPYAQEAFSPLTGEPALLVDFAGAGRAPPEPELEAARAVLEGLACPSLGVCAEPPPGWAPFVESLDAVVASRDALEPVLDTLRRVPLACSALVQLLRLSEELDVARGLVAESLVYSTLQAGPEFAAWLAERPRSPREPGRDAGPPVAVERDGATLRLTLDRPSLRNAFSAEMRDALVEGLRVATCDASIERIVLRGAGPAFCSGGDLDEFGTLPDPATAHAIRSARSPARLLANCAPRVRAELHGACVGAGIELPAFAGRVVAARDAFFQLPELRMGLVPGAGGTVSLPRRIGRQRTAQLALTGARLDAPTAFAWGLVDELR